VARALDRAGSASRIAVSQPGCAGDRDVDVIVYVTAEVIKPEDADAIAAAGRPVLAVLNKADLGRLAIGPNRRRADHGRADALRESLRARRRPGRADDRFCLRSPRSTVWTARCAPPLEELATHPGGAVSLDGSFDGFLAADNPGARRRAAAPAGHPGFVRHSAGHRRDPSGPDGGAAARPAAPDELS